MIKRAKGRSMDLTLADGERACLPILTQAGATPAETYASAELAHWLQQLTGALFEQIPVSPYSVPPSGIVVGQGDVAQKLFPEVRLPELGSEEIVLLTKGRYLLLAGGRPRGTLYAVYQFLQRYGRIRWFAPWATYTPRKRTFRVEPLRVQEKPAFEYREPYWYPAFNGDWAARNCVNGHRPNLTEKHGGKVEYVGFVHTFYWLVPPEQYFAQHPEWYSLIDGKRQAEKAQLCCTNPQLRAFLVDRVRQILREHPNAQIISISQNDWAGACQCEACHAIDTREGTPCASVLDMVNFIAEQLEKEFPHVAFDTLAYGYTRKPTRHLRPRPNVIVRLCSIECSFAQPLEHPHNQDFADDIRGWSERSQRLYVWDYTTNFHHYILPHPNYFVLGDNVRFFHRHGVRGLFEQGAYQSHGAEMAELRAWVLAQLMWNPYQDDRTLIDEFLRGYYGAGARFIKQAMERFAERAQSFKMGCFTQPKAAPYLDLETLQHAERLWAKAEQAVRDDPERLWRVQIGRLPIWYAWLVNWDRLQEEARQQGKRWLMPPTRKALAQRWLERATASGPPHWTPITHVNEWGTTPQQFVESLPE